MSIIQKVKGFFAGFTGKKQVPAPKKPSVYFDQEVIEQMRASRAGATALQSEATPLMTDEYLARRQQLAGKFERGYEAGRTAEPTPMRVGGDFYIGSTLLAPDSSDTKDTPSIESGDGGDFGSGGASESH